MLLAAGASPKAEEGNGEPSPLAEAAGAGSAECVKILLQAGANPNVISAASKSSLAGALEKESSLYRAVRANSPVCLKLLLEGGADVRYHESRGEAKGIPLLVEATSNNFYGGENQVECVRLLLSAGADIQKDSYGIQPIHEAAQNGLVGVLKLLIGAGADVTALDGSGKTPLQRLEAWIENQKDSPLPDYSHDLQLSRSLELLREAEAKKGKAPR